MRQDLSTHHAGVHAAEKHAGINAAEILFAKLYGQYAP